MGSGTRAKSIRQLCFPKNKEVTWTFDPIGCEGKFVGASGKGFRKIHVFSSGHHDTCTATGLRMKLAHSKGQN
jgi:hypothetical protein